MIVAELQQETFNPVFVYKSQGSVSPLFANLPQDSFLLILQSEFQLEMYKKYGSRVLCLDFTHGTNAYCFKLITLMVADDFGNGRQTCVITVIFSFTNQVNL